MKTLHIINGLGVGGAEMNLYKVLSLLDRSRFDAEVISLMGTGQAGLKIAALGIPIRTLGMHESTWNPARVYRLAQWLRRAKPDLVQTWLYYADVLGGVAAAFATRAPVIWNIRHSDLDAKVNNRTLRWTVSIAARLSTRLPTRIVCCSEVSRRIHVDLGYSADRMVVIPNGFDLAQFQPDHNARVAIRCEFRIPESAPLIGLIGRVNPQKDHRTFLRAAGRVRGEWPNVRFLLCGRGATPQNSELAALVRDAGVEDACALLGERNDPQRVAAALDIACSSSAFGEGFPNVIAEAMACGVPCVVTDVGDSARIVGDTGKVVPRRDECTLASAICELIEVGEERRQRLGLLARRRIEENFSLPEIVRRYETLYETVLAGTMLLPSLAVPRPTDT